MRKSALSIAVKLIIIYKVILKPVWVYGIQCYREQRVAEGECNRDPLPFPK